MTIHFRITGKYLLFKPEGYRVIMLNDPLEAVNIARLYDEEHIKQSLIDQRPLVEAYSEFRADYFLLNGSCPLVVSSISPILRGMYNSDHIDFTIPQEGTFVTLENLALSAVTKRDDFVYTFIEYLFKPEVIRHNFEALRSLPSTRNVLQEIDAIPAV